MLTTIAGFPAELWRKDIRTLRLTVKQDGRLCISAPRFLSEERIEQFVREKRDWIERQQARIQSMPAPAEPRYLTGESFVYLGQSFSLDVRKGSADFFFLDLTAHTAVLTLREAGTPESRGKFLTEWRRRSLREIIAERLPIWEQITGLHPNDFSIRDMHTRWGSCNTQTRKIWFSQMLSEKPVEQIDYVILHELCHLRVPNHGADFKSLMNTHMPNWRERKKLLNT